MSLSVPEEENILTALKLDNPDLAHLSDEVLLKYIAGKIGALAPSGGGSSSVMAVKVPNVAREHTIITGANNSVPAGLKDVIINSVTGICAIGSFEIGTDNRADVVAFSSSQLMSVEATLPAIIITDVSGGATWQWIGLQPVDETVV